MTLTSSSPVVETTTPAVAEELPLQRKSQRVVSLDALRGFDMFWIIGGEVIIQELAKLVHWRPIQVLAEQLEHTPWEGFTAYDLIFPMFVFIVGVSLVFSLSKQIAVGGRPAAVRRVIVRGVILYLLGLLYYGGFSKTYHDIRLMGVLQRIAIAYAFAGLMFCYLKPRTMALIAVGVLVGYWAFLSFVPVPKLGHTSWLEGQNWTNWIDAHFLPLRKWDGDHDPEGLLSSFPAIITCVLGVFAGLLVKNERVRPYLKVAYLLIGGAAYLAIGYAWGQKCPEPYKCPIIKKIWTPSFVLVTAGYASVLLALFYLVIDIWKLQLWARPFIWIGMNAITLYLVWDFFSFHSFATRFVGGQFGHQVFRKADDLAIAIVAQVLVLLLARFLYRRQIFLRV